MTDIINRSVYVVVKPTPNVVWKGGPTSGNYGHTSESSKGKHPGGSDPKPGGSKGSKGSKAKGQTGRLQGKIPAISARASQAAAAPQPGVNVTPAPALSKGPGPETQRQALDKVRAPIGGDTSLARDHPEVLTGKIEGEIVQVGRS